MQKLINWIFIISAFCVIVGTFVWASESAKNGDDGYPTGWFWGLVTAFCVWALWHGFSTGLFWQYGNFRQSKKHGETINEGWLNRC